MTTLKDLKEKLLANPDVRAEYDALKLEEQLAARLTQIRLAAGLSQSALAERMGAKQAAIARIESGRHLPPALKHCKATPRPPAGAWWSISCPWRGRNGAAGRETRG